MPHKPSNSTLQRFRSAKRGLFGDVVERLTFSKTQNSSGDFVGTTGTSTIYGYWQDTNGQIIEKGAPVLVEYDAILKVEIAQSVNLGDAFRPMVVKGKNRDGAVYEVYTPAVQRLDGLEIQLKKRS